MRESGRQIRNDIVTHAGQRLCFDTNYVQGRQLAGGPVGPPARWAANSNVEVGYRERQSHKEGREGGNGTG